MNLRSRTIGTQLRLLVAAGLVPMLLIGAVLTWQLTEANRRDVQASLADTAKALSIALDRQLAGYVQALRGAAVADSFRHGDMAAFHALASRVAAVNGALFISFFDEQGRQVLNTALPVGSELPQPLLRPPSQGSGDPLSPDVDSIRRAMQTKAPAYSQLFQSLSTGRIIFTVNIPVARGTGTSVMNAGFPAEVVAQLLSEHDEFSTRPVAIVDGRGTVVARNTGGADLSGTRSRALPNPADLPRRGMGSFEGASGRQLDFAYERSALGDWTAVVAIDRATQAAGSRKVLLAGAGLVLGGALFAVLFAGAMAEALRRAVAGLVPVASGSLPKGTSIRELAEVEHALGELASARRNEASEREQRLLADAKKQQALEAEAELRRTQELLNETLATARMAHFDWNALTQQLTTSPSMKSVFGLRAGEEFVSSEGYLSLLVPEDRERRRALVLAAWQGGEGWHDEFRIVRPCDGEVAWLEERGSANKEPATGAVHLSGLIWDITDRKCAEEAIKETESRFRVMADSSPIMIWVMDTRANIQFVNRAYREFFGVTLQEVLGPNWQPLLHPDDAAQYVSSFLESLRMRKPWIGRARVRRADGQWRWVESRSNPRFSDSGEFLGAVGTSPDITEQIERERALREADRHKDEFLAMLSHELRNPLAALTTAAHVLRTAAPEDAATAGAQGVIDRQTQHMVRLIEDLLDITRVRLGKLSLKREPLDLAALVSEVTQARRAAGAFDARAAVVLEASPVWVHGDRARLEQIYANLLDNALKFTPATGTVRVSVRQEGPQAVLRVADNGRGIAAEALPGVFGLFVQGEQNLDRAQGGLGLGLALVRRLAELHGGEVAAQSDGIGRGTTFAVSLPAIDLPNNPSAGAPRRVDAPAPLRILVVEDNHDARQMLRAALAMQGHDVQEAATGTAGLEAAVETGPDVVLLDIGLPDMDGYEVARRVRAGARRRSPVLIALSGYGREDDRGRAQAAGFDAHIVKPAGAEAIADVIAQVLARNQASAT